MWALGLISVVIFALAFVVPVLTRPGALHRGVVLASEASEAGDLIVVVGDVESRAELMAAVPKSAAIVFAEEARSVAAFGRLFIVSEGDTPQDPPVGCDLIEQRHQEGVSITLCRPKGDVRVRGATEDVFGEMRVETLRGEDRRACARDEGAFRCEHIGNATPVTLTPSCPGQPEGGPSLMLAPPPGAGLSLTLPQPESASRLTLRHSATAYPKPDFSLRFRKGLVQKLAPLTEATPRLDLIPMAKEDLHIEVIERGDTPRICVSLLWEGAAELNTRTWVECATAGRTAVVNGSPHSVAMRAYLRGVSGLPCPH